MKDFPRLLPVWLILLLLILFAMCGCRGGRVLGNGSAGTVIVPQTPQEINESNRRELPRLPMPPLEPLPPVPIVPPANTPSPLAREAARSNPVIPETQSAKANPTPSSPSPAGKIESSFSPTINKNNPSAKLLPVKSPRATTIKGGDNHINITTAPKSSQTADKATSGAIGGKKDKVTFKWGNLVMWWMFLFLVVIFGWVIFDIINDGIKNLKNGKKVQSLSTKKKSPKTTVKSGAKKTTKKAVKKKPINKKK